MVDLEQLSARKIYQFLFAVLITACFFPFSVSHAAAQSGKIHYTKTTHKGSLSPQLAPTATGSRVYWFAMSTNGYASPPISMISSSATGAQTDTAGSVYVMSDSQGNFHISASNSCPTAESFMYFLISGGEVGTAPNNPSIAMMSVIPTVCGSGNFFVDISETTTIAAAYALGSFATFSTDSFATNSNSSSALQSAVAYSSTLINTANAVIPSGSAWQTTLNTLGDMIEACVNSASACPTLFAAATPPGGTAPTDTFQAALNIALNPTLNLTSLFTAIPSPPDFGPILSSAPTSWTLPGSLQITGVSPAPALVGASVTILGSGFGATQGSGVVVIGGVQATVTSWSNTSIVAVVPNGAATDGSVQIFSNANGSIQFPISIGPFFPIIGGFKLPGGVGFTTFQGPANMGVVVTGTSFGMFQGSSTITMDGTPMQVISWSETAITVRLPAIAVGQHTVRITVTGVANLASFAIVPQFP